MAKLTLSVDDEVIAGAKHYAKMRGISISKMVETYLGAVAEPQDRAGGLTPVLRSMRGVLKNANVKDYRLHLGTKYR